MDLKQRVTDAKESLLGKEIRNVKTKFMDSLGPMTKTEHTRADNLWAARITDRKFTEKLERFDKTCEANN
jgi:hypothetical protein